MKKIFNPDNTTEDEDVQNVLEFERITEHPDGSDVIFYPPKGREDSPERVVKEVKEWRAEWQAWFQRVADRYSCVILTILT